jgi:hypothetical protein
VFPARYELNSYIHLEETRPLKVNISSTVLTRVVIRCSLLKEKKKPLHYYRYRCLKVTLTEIPVITSCYLNSMVHTEM